MDYEVQSPFRHAEYNAEAKEAVPVTEQVEKYLHLLRERIAELTAERHHLREELERERRNYAKLVDELRNLAIGTDQ